GDDPRDDPLAEVRVGLSGDRGLDDAGMLQQGRLDLPRTDPVTPALDQVGGPAADESDVAVRLARRDVAGAKPAIFERVCRRVRPAQVSEEQAGSANQELANRLAFARLDRLSVVVDEAELDARKRTPHGPGTAIPVRAHRADHQRLRHPVALDDALPGGAL